MSSASRSDVAPIVGAAVGCFVFGLALASISFYIYNKRHPRRRRRPTRKRSGPLRDRQEFHLGEKGPVVTSRAAEQVLDFLPQPADDAEISNRVHTLIDQISLYVENFYRDVRVELHANLEGQLSRFETPCLPSALYASFNYGYQPTSLIKHCLAYAIFSRLLLPYDKAFTLLPLELRKMAAASEQNSTSHDQEGNVVLALSQWKSLTRYLRPDLTAERKQLSGTQEAGIENFIRQFTSVFSSWESPDAGKNYHTRHLQVLMNDAINISAWLYLQPEGYDFDWNVVDRSTGRDNRPPLVIFPAMNKTSHDGSVLVQPQRMVQPVVQWM